MRTRTVIVAGAALALAGSAAPARAHDGTTHLGAPTKAVDPPSSPAQGGRFGDPFSEPTIGGKLDDATCITDAQDVTICKPAAGSVTMLESGKVLYWNALEGTERVQASIVAEYGSVALNDQSRVLDLLGDLPKWTTPAVADGGANPEGYETAPLIPGLEDNKEKTNDGALFCSDLTFLPDGRVLAAGGTAYYQDPGVGKSGVGVVELEGLRNARIYDPKTDRWEQTGSMQFGRWYPTLVSLPDGDVFTASGVQKLLKPVYPDRPEGSGTNIKQTETYDVQTGKWSDNGEAAQKSLPLFPRLHLLPNGKVFYNTNGQSFNPFGQSYDEVLWNLASTYDPKTKSWKDLGIPGLEGKGVDLSSADVGALGEAVRDVTKAGVPGGGKAATIPGYRGSTFSVMMPLKPNRRGAYTKADFLTAGGVLNPPSPGSYVVTSDSRVTTVTTKGDTETMSTRPTGDLNQPRWYPSGILLPTGEVIAFSGGNRDAVVGPGTEFPVKQAELFDPMSETWKPLAEGHQPRTYHNSALLMPDGRVLIGGHAPITTGYLRHITIPGGFAPNEGRDPSFEIYEPPYLFRGGRPKITAASKPAYGRTMTVTVDRASAKKIRSVVLVRNGTNTHVVDGDQRNVELQVVRRRGSRLTVRVPAEQAVAPPGPYMLFVNKSTRRGLVPSAAKQVRLG